jgi:hypothetical protein
MAPMALRTCDPPAVRLPLSAASRISVIALEKTASDASQPNLGKPRSHPYRLSDYTTKSLKKTLAYAFDVQQLLVRSRG